MSTLTELQTLFHDKYGIEVSALTPEASLQDSGLDSLAIAEFMFAVEDHFHITLPDDDPNINTLAQLADLIDRVKAGLPPPAVLPAASTPGVSAPPVTDAAAAQETPAPHATVTAPAPTTVTDPR